MRNAHRLALLGQHPLVPGGVQQNGTYVRPSPRESIDRASKLPHEALAGGYAVVATEAHQCLTRRPSSSSSALVPFPVFDTAVHVVADAGWCRL
jgi:hypothetical protein